MEPTGFNRPVHMGAIFTSTSLPIWTIPFYNKASPAPTPYVRHHYVSLQVTAIFQKRPPYTCILNSVEHASVEWEKGRKQLSETSGGGLPLFRTKGLGMLKFNCPIPLSPDICSLGRVWRSGYTLVAQPVSLKLACLANINLIYMTRLTDCCRCVISCNHRKSSMWLLNGSFTWHLPNDHGCVESSKVKSLFSEEALPIEKRPEWEISIYDIHMP